MFQRFLCLLLFVSTFLTLSAQLINNKSIWYDEIFTQKSVPGFNFMNDGIHYTQIENGSIQKLNFIKDKKPKTLLKSERFNQISEHALNGYQFSEDEDILILESQKEKIYRHSYKAIYHLYELEKDEIQIISELPIQEVELNSDASHLSYVRENNLYHFDLQTGETHQITQDGKRNAILNGHADWVYEEEFKITKAHKWSADGRYLAFVKFDESEVPVFRMYYYNDDLYPEDYSFKYPKVGENNSSWTLHLYDRLTKKVEEITPKESKHYIPRLNWTPQNELCITQMNRHQNHLSLDLYNPNSNQWRTLYQEKHSEYIEIKDVLHFLRDGSGFIWMSPKSGFQHLYLMNMDGSENRALTSGNFPVTKFYGYDENKQTVYFQAASVRPEQREIFAHDLKNTQTSKISRGEGYHTASFNRNYTYYIDHFSRLNSPTRHAIYTTGGILIKELENNTEIKNLKDALNVSPVSFMKLKSAGKDSLNGYILKPKSFDPSKSYPLFMYVYGGPGSQQVIDKMSGFYWWFQMLTEKGYVVACFDNRGTGARGDKFQKQTYMQLGNLETEDQIALAKQLGALKYIDETRIGIFGWSYGGYLSSSCILKGAEIFKMAIAVAPVTNWKWYDTIYTERYMRTRKENQKGYEENSPVNFAEQLKGKYLIVHGGGDDNVHPQHTHEMVRALIENNKHFDMLYYPNKNHGINGGFTRWHLFDEITEFIKENL